MFKAVLFKEIYFWGECIQYVLYMKQTDQQIKEKAQFFYWFHILNWLLFKYRLFLKLQRIETWITLLQASLQYLKIIKKLCRLNV